jgi:hypothetical protein
LAASLACAGDGGRSTTARSSPGLYGKAHDNRLGTALAAARYQVIPSITAAMAAARTATVAVSTVTARADRRNSRSRRACETAVRGKAEGIAGRISTRIRMMLLPRRSCAHMSAPRSKSVRIQILFLGMRLEKDAVTNASARLFYAQAVNGG